MRVARQAVEHVIEEANAGSDLGATAAIQVEHHLNTALACLAADMGGTWGHGRVLHSSSGW